MDSKEVPGLPEDDERLIALWLSGRPVTTCRVYEAEARAFLNAMSHGLKAVTADEVITYIGAIVGAPATRARRVSTIRSFLDFAVRLGHTASNLTSVARAPKVTGRLHERLLDEQEVAAAINEAQPGRDRSWSGSSTGPAVASARPSLYDGST